MVLEGRADGSASGFYQRIRIDPARHPVIEWRWRVLQTPGHTDPRVHSRDDSPARVIVAFHGDVKRLDIGERFALALYHALTGDKMPYAIIMYSWASDAPVGTITSNDQTGKIQTIVVGGGIGEWREFRRKAACRRSRHRTPAPKEKAMPRRVSAASTVTPPAES